MNDKCKLTSDYKKGDLVFISPGLKLYTYNVTDIGSVEQQELALDEEEFIVGIIYDILTDEDIPYCQVKFLVGNDIYYFDSHESSTPYLKIISMEK